MKIEDSQGKSDLFGEHAFTSYSQNMNSTLEVGTARAQPGKIIYGELEALELPSGGSDYFPIIIAQGKPEGPVLWITASIHGAEYTGIPVIHQLLTRGLVNRLNGTIVAVPTLNPAGLRSAQRSPYYLNGQDPNRLFPAPPPRRPYTQPETPPSGMEEAYTRLFGYIQHSANYLIDLHNYSPGALSFAFRDPVYYRGGRDRSAAQQLQAKMSEMLAAFGHTIVNEYASAEYLKMNLHRSVSGAAFNVARIPAFTAELGGFMSVDQSMVMAAVSGIRNVMRWAGMLAGDPEPILGIKIMNPGYPIRRMLHPVAPASGICSYYVKAGDTIAAGDPIARLTDIYGRPLGSDDGLVLTRHDGIVLGVSVGAVCYKNEPLLSLAIRDDSELVLPFPSY
ncbi:MAG: succinylglutamate desuccinylase/aspartoacylase family protein [Chloroflexota bacterium]